MNEHDDPLDEYLRTDSAVSKAYRELPAVEVPAALDALVLQRANQPAAEATVSEIKPKIVQWRRWSLPLGIAASGVIALSVTFEVIKSGKLNAPEEAKPSVVYVQQQSNLKAPAAEVQIPAPEVEHAAAPNNSRGVDAQARDEVSPAADKPLPAAAPPPVAAMAESLPVMPPPIPSPGVSTPLPAAGSIVVTREAPAEPQRATSAADNKALAKREAGVSEAKASSRDEFKQDEATRRRADPAQWLAYIQAQRAAGKVALADEELLEFKKAWPNYLSAAQQSSSSSSSTP